MRDLFSKAPIARILALARVERLSPPMLTPLLVRLAAFAKAKRLSPLMLAALCLLSLTTTLSALFLLRALLGWGEPETLATAEWRAPSASLAASLPAAAAPADTQTLTRPIFVKSRRPPAKSAETAMSKDRPGPPPAVTVQAIVLSNGASRAYLAAQGKADGDWYGVGQLVEGWTISEIRASELTVKSSEQTATLSLYPATPTSDDAETKSPPITTLVDSNRQTGGGNDRAGERAGRRR